MDNNQDTPTEIPRPGLQIGPDAWLHFRRGSFPSPEAIAEWNQQVEKLRAEGVPLFQDGQRWAVQLYPQRPTLLQRLRAMLPRGWR